MAERIGTIIEHHGTRIREMLDILDANPGMTPYDLLRPYALGASTAAPTPGRTSR